MKRNLVLPVEARVCRYTQSPLSQCHGKVTLGPRCFTIRIKSSNYNQGTVTLNNYSYFYVDAFKIPSSFRYRLV
jgi:hypothetical protein